MAGLELPIHWLERKPSMCPFFMDQYNGEGDIHHILFIFFFSSYGIINIVNKLFLLLSGLLINPNTLFLALKVDIWNPIIMLLILCSVTLTAHGVNNSNNSQDLWWSSRKWAWEASDTAHDTLHTVHYTLHTTHCTLHSTQYKLQTSHYILNTTH